MAKATVNRNGKPAPVKVLKQARIVTEGREFVARDVRTMRRVSAGETAERCRYNTTFRHGYEVLT